jgi:putative oxidoreductase
MKVLERYQKQVIAVFRIVIGFLFASHGAAAVFGVLGTKQAELFAWPSWWAAAIQFAGGALVLIGLGTRYAALLCSGSMAYAYFTVHQVDALLPVQNGGETRRQQWQRSDPGRTARCMTRQERRWPTTARRCYASCTMCTHPRCGGSWSG